MTEEQIKEAKAQKKMAEDHKKIAERATNVTEKDTPKPIEYVGQPWINKSRPIVLITETEDSEARIEEVTSGQAFVGKTVMKQFEAELFCGQVVTAIKKRGRYLYHVVYEDGDEEDLNDLELQEALELYKIETDKTFKASVTHETNDECENEYEKSGGETEGSEYNLSEDDQKKPKQKRRTTRNKQIKEKAKNGGKQNQKEEDDTNGKQPVIIDVDALFQSSSKKSVTAKTMASMTEVEKKEIIGTAWKSLLKQAKKGFRAEAMKVCSCVVCCFVPTTV
jgi:hypothetical protein